MTPQLAQVSMEPVFGWYVVIPLAVIMLASLWLTLTTAGLSSGGRITLMLLRLTAMVVLLLGWLRPGFISTSQRESAGAVAVLMDRSESMTLPSGSSDQNRWAVQREVWSAIQSATNLKIGETKIVPYFFDARPVPAAADDLPSLDKTFAIEPEGRSTDLGRALSEIGQLQLDPPLRGVIVMSDAMQTVLPPEIDASIVARQMSQLDQPILFVGIGPSGDKSQLRDVAIEGLPEHFSAFVKKELSIRMVVSAQGMRNQPIKVRLRLRASGQPYRVVDTRQISASRSNEKLPLAFNIVVPEQGDYLLEASVSVDTREQIETNNVAISFITVREGGARILFLTGQPLPEQLFLKRSLNESLDFDIQYAWFQENERKSWPIDLSKTANLQEFDAIVLADLDASVLSGKSASQLAERIQNGAGLLLTGGYHSFDAGSYGRSRILNSLFPVKMQGSRYQRFGQPIDRSLHNEGDIKLRPTRPHPITNLMPEPDNSSLWRSLKPLTGMNRLGPVRPGAQILLKSEQGDPVLVAGQYGSRGRVLAFAGDSTWQWWLSGRKKIHQQFWRQAMLWLLRRDSLEEGFRLDLDRRRLLIDESPDLAIEWFGGSKGKPMPDTVRIQLSRDGRPLQDLSATKSSSNMQKAKIVGLDKPGLYEATLTADGSDGAQYEADIAFIVRDESRELSRPEADWQMMTNIVSANRTAGGQLVLPEDIGGAIAWLRERQEATKVTLIEKRRLGDAAWDAWLYLTVFCVLMSIEWGLRKAWQLP